jgi:hypothetical protein
LPHRWKKTSNNKAILSKKYDIRLKRMAYLQKMMKFREEGRPIVFTDETYVHSSHTTPFQWTSGDAHGLRAPLSKGQRLIIVHAG